MRRALRKEGIRNGGGDESGMNREQGGGWLSWNRRSRFSTTCRSWKLDPGGFGKPGRGVWALDTA